MDRHDEEGTTDRAALRVVLVEDHPEFREQLRHMLEACAGVRVVHAAGNAEAAVRWLDAHPHHWDLLVLDIFLDQGHGFHVLRACRARAQHQRAVFLTSYTREPARSQALALGADAVFDKSLQLGAFLRFARECSRTLAAAHPA